ncbi:MAG: ABC transporter permease subunit [Eubacteriales bacterium]
MRTLYDIKEKSKKSIKRKVFMENWKKYGDLSFFYIPAIVFSLIFTFVPLLGLVMAFKENPNLFGTDTAIQGIIEAKWVGFANFKSIFESTVFTQALRNTLVISGLKIVILFPLPIILAIMISEMSGKIIKGILQKTMYIPYLLSWAIIGGIFAVILNQNTGVVNYILVALGHESIPFVTSNETFRGVLVVSQGWKDLGWSSIVYISAITAIDRNQIEAAKIDGATKMQQICHVMLPGIMPVIAAMLVLRVGGIMNAGFEQIFTLYSPYIQETGDIIGTYTYRLIRESSLVPQYALSTAVGFFNAVVALILIVCSNVISRKFLGKGIW